ncbi:murein L,D-transpeptidase, partial [Streptomyces scabiei]|nr:murein L,D-transpeptidase [Streptomyces scabiei]
MRTKDMRRSMAALAALALAGACTATGIEVHGDQRGPVRVDVTGTPSGTPRQGSGETATAGGGTVDGDGGGDRDADGGTDDKGGRGQTPPPRASPSPT